MCNAINENLNTNSKSETEVNKSKAVNKDVTVNYNIFFKDKALQLPVNNHERPFKEVKILDDRIDNYNKKSWGVEQYEYKTCNECGCPIVGLDPLRGERVCECGMTNKRVMMIADLDLDKQMTKEPFHYTGNQGFTYDEKKVLKSVRKAKHKTKTRVEETKKGNRGVYLKNNTKTADWRKKQQILILDTISSQLLMTKHQKDKVKRILDNHSLKMVHSRVSQKTIIAGICRYVLMKDGRGKELRFNRHVFEFVGLNESNYNIIRHNIDRLGII